MRQIVKRLIFILIFSIKIISAEIFIPMDDIQTNHLKAYGIAFEALKKDNVVRWLPNYRGGSYLIENSQKIEDMCKKILVNPIKEIADKNMPVCN